ncbi:MAG: FG-GAP-like repeat-containing protein [Desulfotignum sp.]|nr:FG-GAP-like repeat-containing protein [Desulfotignum sp.]
MLKAVAFVLFFSLFGIFWLPMPIYADYYPSLNNWMRNLDDDLLITELTIPGTHDSAADRGHCAENSACKAVIDFVSTQQYDIQEQLEWGVRFFDIRLAYNENNNRAFKFHHGPYDLKQSLYDGIRWATDFLKANPSEFLIWLIKQEHTDARADVFWRDLSLDLADRDIEFYSEKKILTVGEARGKVIVMARNKTSEYPQGYHVEWPDNTVYYQGNDKDLIYVAEDHYSLNTVASSTKFVDIRRNLFLARNCVGCGSSESLFFTFLSGEGDIANNGPAHYADYENIHTSEWLKQNAHGGPRSGIIAMDFAGFNQYGGDDVILACIGQNYPHKVPCWFGSENAGGGISATDINGNGEPDLVVFNIDDPSGANGGYYRIGWDLDKYGQASEWSFRYPIPWQGKVDQGGGITATDLNGDGTPDLIVFFIDAPSGENAGYCRIGYMNSDGTASKWTDSFNIPGWFGGNNDGGGITATDINGNGEPDLVVFNIDDPSGANGGYYRIGWDLDKDGKITSWSDHQSIPWQGNHQQGGGITATDVNGDGIPDLIVFMIDNPSGPNAGYYRIGYMDSAGNATEWRDFEEDFYQWFGNENQGAGITVADVDGNGKSDLILFFIDNPVGENQGYYRILWDEGSSK